MSNKELIRPRYRFRHSKSWVRAAVISYNSQYLFTTDSVDVKQWDLKTGDLIRTYRPPSDVDNNPVGITAQLYTRLAVSQDGRKVAAGKQQATVDVWDVESGEFLGYGFILGEYRLGTDEYHDITGVAFNPEGTKLIASIGTAYADCFDLTQHLEPFPHRPNRKEWRAEVSPTGVCTQWAMNRDGTVFISSHGGTLTTSSWRYLDYHRVRDAYSAEERQPRQGPDVIGAIALSADEKCFATGFYDGSIKLWRTATRLPVWHRVCHGDPNPASKRLIVVEALSFAGADELLLSAAGKTLAAWDMTSGQQVYACQGKADERTFAAAVFSRDNTTVVTADGQGFRSDITKRGFVTVWDIDDELRYYNQHKQTLKQRE